MWKIEVKQMKVREKRRKLLIFISALLLLFVMSIYTLDETHAKTTITDLEKQREEIDKKIEKEKERIAFSENEIDRIKAEILEIETKLNELYITIYTLENSIEAKEQEIIVTREKIEEAKQEEQRYYNLMKERIKVMYEYGNTEYIEVLFESKSTADFFNRMEYLNKIVSYDKEIMKKLKEAKERIVNYENKLVLEKGELGKLVEKSTAKLNENIQLEAKKEQKVEAIEESIDLLEANIRQEEAEDAELEQLIKDILALSQDAQLLEDDWKLTWPVPGRTYISSYFGMRYHPILHYNRMHNGIDIPAPLGTNIIAAASGIVIKTGWNVSRGNYVYVNHGKDKNGNYVITDYNHLSATLVKKDDVITRGTVLGKMGSTGYSTGSHLHFGVKIGNKYTNPLLRLNR